MISDFTLRNMTTLSVVKFGQDFDCDYLYLSGGLDWGNVPASHNTYNYPNQIGDTFSSTKINNRDISVEGWVFYVLSEDEKIIYSRGEWQNYAYGKIKEAKKKLNELINPQDILRFTIGNFYIEGKATATPQYGIEESDNNVYFCRFMFNVFCANPMFKKIIDSQTFVRGDNGAFHFPFILEPTGYIMGTRIDYLMLIIQNEGDVSVGGEIKLIAKGEVKNPVLENMNTGEKIKISKTMQQGEVITINTVDGEAKGITGYYNGVLRDYLQYWNFSENTWFNFVPGATMLGYSTENQSETLLEITVTINPAKFGLEEM